MIKIAVINGPNLNMLGSREKNHYGDKSLKDIENELMEHCKDKAVLEFFQSNYEGKIVDYIQHLNGFDAIVINPGAFTHTSIAIRDALLTKNLLVIEIHLSNIYKRESFRRTSYFSDIALGVISGFKDKGYKMAIEALISYIKQ